MLVKTLYTFTFNKFPIKVKLSEKQRDKYFEYKNGDIKSGSKKVFRKCIKKEFKKESKAKPQHLVHPFLITGVRGDKIVGGYCEFKDGKIVKKSDNYNKLDINLSKTDKKKKLRYIVIDLNTLKPVIANPTQAGTSKYHIIKGQDFYSGLNPFIRSKIVDELHQFYLDNFDYEVDRLDLSDNFPIEIHLTIYDIIENNSNSKKSTGSNWDVGNKGYPYIKTFSDFISTDTKDFNKLIPDDEKLYVYSERVTYVPIKNREDRKLVFKLKTSSKIQEIYKNIIKWKEKKL